MTELNRRINVLAKHCIEQQFKDLEENVAGVKRAHAAILRGKSVSVNSAFNSFRRDRPCSSADAGGDPQ